MSLLDQMTAEIERLGGPVYHGRVSACLGTTVSVAGLQSHLAPGDKCRVIGRSGQPLLCEVVGFRDGCSVAMPFGSVDDVVAGSRVEVVEGAAAVRPGPGWIGRVFNALGEPVDGKGAVRQGDHLRRLRVPAISAYRRRRMGGRLDTGIRAINSFVPVCKGQRMGIFAGSGVGKSTLLSMMVRSSCADVNVIGLIGERGREVQDFLQEQLGADGLARSVLVVATSDESPQMRRQAAYLTMTIAESFRDAGLQVLCVMDSITRFAAAQREIGLAVGEPPTSKGYPPSVFAELPRLLERSGPGAEGQGDITGIFTILVDGDDTNEPIADAVRGILDGHIVLDRGIAERGRFPAIDILRSVSRALPGCHGEAENALIREGRAVLAEYENLREMIRIGAYRAGASPEVDRAVALHPKLEAFLGQGIRERATLAESFAGLETILKGDDMPVSGASEVLAGHDNVMPFGRRERPAMRRSVPVVSVR